MLTRVDYPSIAGINGVAWDAVELPSQFLENYAWQPDVLQRISGHVTTGAPLPRSCKQRLIADPQLPSRAADGAAAGILRCFDFRSTPSTTRRLAAASTECSLRCAPRWP